METKGLCSMNLYKKQFSGLTADELYRILQTRCAVFVVEQKCAYQDLDGIDRQALHVWLEDEGQILAYLRIFAVPDLADAVQIGRVLTTVRGKGLGTKILQAGIAAILGFSQMFGRYDSKRSATQQVSTPVKVLRYKASHLTKTAFLMC